MHTLLSLVLTVSSERSITDSAAKNMLITFLGNSKCFNVYFTYLLYLFPDKMIRRHEITDLEMQLEGSEINKKKGGVVGYTRQFPARQELAEQRGMAYP